MLKGIDVSQWKADLNLAAIPFDFVIAKATGGASHVDPNCDAFIQKAIHMGKKWGVFHYFSDSSGDINPVNEAHWFVNNCKGYIGKGILVLDWERGGNPAVGSPAVAKVWLDTVHQLTGVKPLIYMSLSTVKSYNWSEVIKAGYGLWCAAWPNGDAAVTNYNMDPKRDPNPMWDGVVNDAIWQFTSTGKLTGYGGNLDCDFFYGTAQSWDAYAHVNSNPAPAPEPTTTIKPTTTVAPPPPEPTTTVAPPPVDTTTLAPPDPAPTTTQAPVDTTTAPPQPGETTTTTSAPDNGADTPPHQSRTQIVIEFIKSILRAIFGPSGKGN